MGHWTDAELVAAGLFILTGVLLVVASNPRGRAARQAAVASVLTVVGGDYFLLKSYAGEPALLWDPPASIDDCSGDRQQRCRHVHREKAAQGGGAGAVSVAWVAGNPTRPSSSAGKAERQRESLLADCPGCPDLVLVRPGFFQMGASAGDEAATAFERPTRWIGFGSPFAIGRTEVTVQAYGDFLRATGHAPPECPQGVAEQGGALLPVTCVSARDADAYVKWLAGRTGKRFRLPSEAEWEYAARAGAATRFADGESADAVAANVGERGHRHPVAVGSYRPNAFGIHDMHGNAAEIVAGCWSPSLGAVAPDGKPATPLLGCAMRVLRDGHAGEDALAARSSARRPLSPAERRPGVGFRIMRELD